MSKMSWSEACAIPIRILTISDRDSAAPLAPPTPIHQHLQPKFPQNHQLPPTKAAPSKAFFVDMLTKDVALSVCILDLIDNSIQSLIEDSKLDVSEHLIAGTKAKKMKGRIDVSFN